MPILGVLPVSRGGDGAKASAFERASPTSGCPGRAVRSRHLPAPCLDFFPKLPVGGIIAELFLRGLVWLGGDADIDADSGRTRRCRSAMPTSGASEHDGARRREENKASQHGRQDGPPVPIHRLRELPQDEADACTRPEHGGGAQPDVVVDDFVGRVLCPWRPSFAMTPAIAGRSRR
jgi:hypothetical protein